MVELWACRQRQPVDMQRRSASDARASPKLAPDQTIPHPPRPNPFPAALSEVLCRLPRLPWPRVANDMPPIPGPSHRAPGSKHASTNCRIGRIYMYQSIFIC